MISTKALMESNNEQKILEDEFKATFIKELMPGILHNFANPLNGIMGRSKLLQRRIHALDKKLAKINPDASAALVEEMEKIKSDVRSVNNESEVFFGMFRDVSSKFYALASPEDERISLSQMLASEMRFADFYLEFKHEIAKTLAFDSEVPEFKGNAGELSLSFWRLIRFAMAAALDSKKKEFFLSTGHDRENVHVQIKYTTEEVSHHGGNPDPGMMAAIEILKKYLAEIQFLKEEGTNAIVVRIPSRIAGD